MPNGDRRRRSKKKRLIKPLVERPTPTIAQPAPTYRQGEAIVMTQMMNKQPEPSPVVSTSLEKLISKPAQNSNEKFEAQHINVNNDFLLQDLQQCIQKYAEQLTIEQILLKNALLDGVVTLNKDCSFDIAVFNPSQQNELQINSNETISFLRHNLKNSRIKMTVRLVEKEEHEMIYTSTEKLHYLNSKNPNIEKLIEMFNLSLE